MFYDSFTTSLSPKPIIENFVGGRFIVVLMLLLTVGAFFLTPEVRAQAEATSGQINGTVRDASEAVVPNATITVTNTATGLERSVTSNDEGVYQIVQLPAGTYTVRVASTGFAEVTSENVTVGVGRATVVNVTLGAADVNESVTVTAESIQLTRNEADALLNEAQIDNLPINGRRFQDFVTLTPNTLVIDSSTRGTRGQISLSGQRGINSNISIDGADYNQPFFGGIRGGERSNSAFTIPQESIQEFQVVSNGYSAEFGRSTGGIVNAVTKSGTNEIRGSAFYLIRPQRLARSNEYFDTLETSLGREVTPAPTQQQFGGSFGGPIKRDRMFYFFAYEQQLFKNPRQVFFSRLGQGFTATDPTNAALSFFRSLEVPFDQTNDAYAGLGRFDYQINDNNRFNVRFNTSQNVALNAVSTGTALSPATTSALSNNGTERDRTNTGVAQLNTIFSPTVVNELRVQYSREDRPRLPNAIAPTVATGIGTFGTVNFLPTTQFDYRVQVADSVTPIFGNHTVKIGAEYNYTFANQIFAQSQTGEYFNINGTGSGNAQVNSILDVLTPGGTIANRFDATGIQYRGQIGNGFQDLGVTEIAGFVQDSWRVRPNLTLNYGVRFEEQINQQPPKPGDADLNESLSARLQNITFPNGRTIDPTFIPSSGMQVGPRIGFAYDPFSNGRTVIRGGAGIYYARTPLLLFTSALNNFRLPPGNLRVTLPFSAPAGNPNTTLYRQFQLIGINLNNFTLETLPTLTPAQFNQIGAALGLEVDPFRGASVQPMAPDYKNPRSYQGNFGVERELAPGFTVGADFAQVNTVYLQRNRDVNLPAPFVRPNDPAQRPFFGLRTSDPLLRRTRPLPSLEAIEVRESTARSSYRSFTVRSNLRRRYAQLNAYYTLARNLSDDDNERQAGGVFYENSFNLTNEYSYSNLDVRHQFVANPVAFLPYGFEVSSAIRLRSGTPVDVFAVSGQDLNEDRGGNTDRPYSAPGVPFRRNAFRNPNVYNVDVRAQKGFNLFGENRRLVFSGEVFNLFNFQNIQFNGAQALNYCNSAAELTCGFDAPTNPTFLQTRDSQGRTLLNNDVGSPFQVQLGVRLQF